MLIDLLGRLLLFFFFALLVNDVYAEVLKWIQ
jgi:hypothetical protein